MKTLLVLIKNQDEAESIIKYAVDLARDLKTNIHLFYVENPSSAPLGTPDLMGAAAIQLQRSLEKKIKAGREAIADQLKGMMHKISGEVMVEISEHIGDELTLIGEMVETGKVQMVMIEGQGMDSFTLQRSFAKELIRNVQCPVWLIPKDTEYQPFHNIIYATDYHIEDIPTLKKLIDLTHLVSPQVTALHINDNADFDLRIKMAGFQKMLETKTEYNKISVKALVENEGDDIVSLINKYAASYASDLIVLLKENQHFLERLFKPSTTEKMIKKAKWPVLIYHTHNE
ncbi:MAG: universal stress protein [Bacteroidota bacterium]|nr:universal stress protein [Bacteroidota bacterium]